MWIKERIDSEFRKHKKLDWSQIAESKIKSQIKDILDKSFDIVLKSNEKQYKKYKDEKPATPKELRDAIRELNINIRDELKLRLTGEK